MRNGWKRPKIVMWLEREDYNHTDLLEMNAHLILGVVKFGHQFVDTLTRGMLCYEFAIKSQSPPPPNVPHKAVVPFFATSIKVGIKFINTTTFLGDMGYAYEEFLFKDGLRIKMECYEGTWKPRALYFEKVRVLQENVRSRKKAGETVMVKDHVHMEKLQVIENEVMNYLGPLRAAFEDHLASPNDATAEALYGAFQLNVHTVTSNIGDRRIPENAKERKRKHADTMATKNILHYAESSAPTELLLTTRSSSSSVAIISTTKEGMLIKT